MQRAARRVHACHISLQCTKGVLRWVSSKRGKQSNVSACEAGFWRGIPMLAPFSPWDPIISDYGIAAYGTFDLILLRGHMPV